jgi:hypothetical protein
LQPYSPTDEVLDQVTFRNSSSPLGTAWTALKISWAWRDRARLNIPRFILAAIPPILVFAGFAVASVLSSKVAAPPTEASEVRLLQNNCGYLDWRGQSSALGNVTQQGLTVDQRYYAPIGLAAQGYARSCYGNKTRSLASCNLYTVPSLPYLIHDSAPCPFGGNRCILGQNTAFRMQTAWLNSHEHFGINAPPKDRVEYRRTSTCSVLNITDLITTTSTGSGTIYWYHLGYTGPLTKRQNYTFEYNDVAVNLGIGYTLSCDYQYNPCFG